jgi:uncharacterized iron-regulated membrane protein
LVSGLVVFVVCISGCLYSFQEEISEARLGKMMFVAPPGADIGSAASSGSSFGSAASSGSSYGSALPISQLRVAAQKALGPGQPVDYMVTYRDPKRAWEFMAYSSNDTALTYFGSLNYFRSAYVNPYTGVVTGVRDYKYDFFGIVKYIHWSLLLNTRIGQPIVGWSTLIFVVLLITGLVLWWPKRWNRANRRKSFKVMWKAHVKRLNYDLHNVLGFYTLLLALVLGLTGMVYAFDWFSKWVTMLGTDKPVLVTSTLPVRLLRRGADSARQVLTHRTDSAWQVLAHRTDTAVQVLTHGEEEAAHTAEPIDRAFAQAQAAMPDARRIGVSPAFGLTGTLAFTGYRGRQIYYDRDILQYDQYSTKLLSRDQWSKKKIGDKLVGMNYDLHVGAVGGLSGKIIAFLICLVCASLPVTGFLVWWWKRRKKPAVSRVVQDHRKQLSPM